MSKQTLYTVIGITLSFVIAVGGWLITSALIDKKSDVLISATGITNIDAPSSISIGPTGTADIDGFAQKMTETEIANILMNWQSADCEKTPHEPMPGQIGMEKAIETGKYALLLFSDSGIIPAEMLELDQIKSNAYLCQNLPRGKNERFLAPIYSYWTVSHSSAGMKATLIVNAVTGQVWQAEIAFSPAVAVFGGVDAEQALKTFVAYLGLYSGEKVYVKYEEGQSVSASQRITGGLLGVDSFMSIRKTSVEALDDLEEGKAFLQRIWMSLYPVSHTYVESAYDGG